MTPPDPQPKREPDKNGPPPSPPPPPDTGPEPTQPGMPPKPDGMIGEGSNTERVNNSSGMLGEG